MPKWFKKISWAANGIIIGLIIAGMVDRSFTTMVLGAVIGLVIAAAFKTLAWYHQRRDGW